MSGKEPNNKSTSQNPVGRFMVAVGAIIELKDSNKILLIQRAKGLDWQPNEWETMYGRIDQFEEPIDGLKREVNEEVGLSDLKIVDILEAWHLIRGTKNIPQNDLIGITYWARTDQEIIRLSNEHQGYKWATPQDALEIIKIEGIRRDVLKFIEKRSKF